MLNAFVLPGVSLGVSAGTLPGPLQAYLIHTTLALGWRKGLYVIFSPLLADAPIVILIVFLLGQLPDSVIQAIRLIGGLFLLWIAHGAWKQYQGGVAIAANTGKPQAQISGIRVLMTAVGMNLLSPGPYLFWGTVNGPLLLRALDESWLHAFAFLLAFYGAFLTVMIMLVFVFRRLGELNERIARRILLFAIALLVWFGAFLIAETFDLITVHRVVSLIVIFVVGIRLLWRVVIGERQSL